MKVASRAEVYRDWTGDEVIAAHRMLDAIDAAEAYAVARAHAQNQPRQRPRQ
jgi:hypothetical protein